MQHGNNDKQHALSFFCMPHHSSTGIPNLQMRKLRDKEIKLLRSEIKSRQSGSRTFCLNLYFVKGCCSVNLVGKWPFLRAQELPCSLPEPTKDISFLHFSPDDLPPRTFHGCTSWMRNPLGCCLFAWKESLASLSVVTSPVCLLSHDLDENSLKWCLEEIFQNSAATDRSRFWVSIWSLRVCISNHFPSDADVAGLQTALKGSEARSA